MNVGAHIVPMSNIVPALKAELVDLQRQLQADPRYIKIARIQDLLRTYESDAAYQDAKPGLDGAIGDATIPSPLPPVASNWSSWWPVDAKNGVLPHLPPVPGRQPPKIERVKSEIRGLLAHKTIAHRKDILAHLTARGVMGHEKDPMASLAAYLSGFKDDFVFDGNGNYSLKPS
jgi:hypothetical protein